MAYPASFANITFRMLSIFNLFTALPSEEVAIEFAVESGLIPGRDFEFECKKCKRHYVYETRNDRKPGWRYRCNGCKQSISPLKNTFFEQARIDIRDILQIVFSFVSNIPVYMLTEQSQISETTIIQWYTYCREVCMTIINQDCEDDLIGGENMFVEVDEAHLSTRKDHKGRCLKGEQLWVFGFICRETKQCKIVRVPDRKKSTLMPLMQKYIHPDSYIVTDSAKVYEKCEDYGFQSHYSVNHSKYFVNPKEKLVYTNTIENLWGRLKPTIKSHQSKLTIDHYIGEWCYREKYFKEFDQVHNAYNRIAPGLRFEKFITDIIRLYPGYGKIGLINPFYDRESPPTSPKPTRSPIAISPVLPRQRQPRKPRPPTTPPKPQTTQPRPKPIQPSLFEIESDRIQKAKQILNYIMNACAYTAGLHSDLTLLENNLNIYKTDLKDISNALREANIYKFHREMRIDIHQQELPPAFLQNYTPVRTSPNGDCLYNAVSICLFGHERYSPAIRISTVEMLHKYRAQFIEMVRRKNYDVDAAICGAGTSHDLLGLATTTYGQNVMNEYHWANALSNVATSLAIGRPIYIYATFRRYVPEIGYTDEWLFDSGNKTSEELNQLRANGASLVIGMESMIGKRNPIRILLHSRHYTALLPCCPNPFEFKPTGRSENPKKPEKPLNRKFDFVAEPPTCAT